MALHRCYTQCTAVASVWEPWQGTHDVRCAITSPCHLGTTTVVRSSAMILRHDAPIRCAHLSNGRGALSHQQSRLSFRKTVRGKNVGPTRGFTASPEVGPRATVGTLQTGYPRVYALGQDKRHDMHPHALTCHHGTRTRLPA
jgi:hypothetical protein